MAASKRKDEEAKAKVPTFTTYFNPILQCLRELGGSATLEELNSRVAAKMNLSDEILAVPHNPEHGGESAFAYRMAWARTYLKAVGLITNSERAVWSLTPLGRETERVDERAVAREAQKLRKGKRPRPSSKPQDPEEEHEDNEETPEWSDEVLRCLFDLKSDAFERLSMRLLRENGFVEVEVTGRSGDQGIDGVGLMKLQGMLTFPVIFQCKRWKNAVSAGTIRDFRGAMVGRTDNGLVITTSYFTPDAIREAKRDGAPPIELVDGEALVQLLKKLRLGVKTELVEHVTVDPEWFKTI